LIFYDAIGSNFFLSPPPLKKKATFLHQLYMFVTVDFLFKHFFSFLIKSKKCGNLAASHRKIYCHYSPLFGVAETGNSFNLDNFFFPYSIARTLLILITDAHFETTENTHGC
jgi:hypothetical protein